MGVILTVVRACRVLVARGLPAKYPLSLQLTQDGRYSKLGLILRDSKFEILRELASLKLKS